MSASRASILAQDDGGDFGVAPRRLDHLDEQRGPGLRA